MLFKGILKIFSSNLSIWIERLEFMATSIGDVSRVYGSCQYKSLNEELNILYHIIHVYAIFHNFRWWNKWGEFETSWKLLRDFCMSIRRKLWENKGRLWDREKARDLGIRGSLVLGLSWCYKINTNKCS